MDEDIARIMVRAMGYAPQVDLRTAIVWTAQPAEEKANKRQVIEMAVPEKLRAVGQEPVTAVRLGDHVYTSGVPGIDPKTGALPEDPVQQFENAFNNLRHLLERSGVSGQDSVGLINVYIPNREARRFINKSWYDLYPGTSRPARKTNQVPLPDGMMVQLQAIAMIGQKHRSLEIPGLAHRDPLPMGTRIGDMVFSSVIGGDDPKTGLRVPGGPRAQMDRAFANVEALMQQAGGTAAGVNHLWVFLPREFSHQKTMLDSYLALWDKEGDRPARKTIPYDLPEGNEIQIQFIGHVAGKRTNFEAPGIGHHDPIPMGSRCGNVFHSSGVHGIIPNTDDKMDETLEPQIEQTIANVHTLMQQAGGSLDNIALLTVFIRKFGDEKLVMHRLQKIFPDWNRAPALRFIRYDMPRRMQVQFHVTAVFP
jgi:2-iminobutanoate/2-iminopropanoate deaminase